MPSNVSKFVYGEDLRENFRNIVMKVVEGNVILSGEDVYAWWLPRSSPMSEDGAWYQLKTIEFGYPPTSLWTKLNSHQHSSEYSTAHIRKVVEDKRDCFIVPMKDVLYHYDQGVDGHNFHMYVKDGSYIYYGVTETQVEHSEHTLYSLMDNSVVLEPKPRWAEFEWIQTDNLIYPEGNEPTTPNAPNSTVRNLVNDFDNEAFNNNATMRLIEESYASDPVDDYDNPFDGYTESDNESYSTTTEDEAVSSEDDDEVATIVDGILVDDDANDSDYEPSVTSSGSSYDDYDDYDEYRLDVSGGWYTRRQFYDFYGSDEAWDNLDPSTFHRMRQDEYDGYFYTEEELFQWYGTHDIWKKMHPKNMLIRRTLCSVFHYATYMHPNLQTAFICRMMDTYS